MANGEVLDELRQILASGDVIPQREALRLLMAGQSETLKTMKQVEASQRAADDRIENLERALERLAGVVEAQAVHATEADKRLEMLEQIAERMDRYPPMLFLWATDKKKVFYIFLGACVLYTILFVPVNISDVRHAILDFLGLPFLQ